jgi:hypothetical protein
VTAVDPMKPTPPERDRHPPVTLEVGHDVVVGLRKAAAARDPPVKALICDLLAAIAADSLVMLMNACSRRARSPPRAVRCRPRNARRSSASSASPA